MYHSLAGFEPGEEVSCIRQDSNLEQEGSRLQQDSNAEQVPCLWHDPSLTPLARVLKEREMSAISCSV